MIKPQMLLYHKWKIIVIFLSLLLLVQLMASIFTRKVNVFDFQINQLINIHADNKRDETAEKTVTVAVSHLMRSSGIAKSTITNNGNSQADSTGETKASALSNQAVSRSVSAMSNLSSLSSLSERTTHNTALHNVSSTLPSIENASSNDFGLERENVTLPLCGVLPPVLVGPIRVWFDKPTFPELEQLYPDLEPGGHDRPKHCISRHRVAVIIPYRDRELQLRVFLHNLHSLLHKQELDYAIYVIEQIANQTFNRAKLMNIGFLEARKRYDFQCFIFHDVDLLPEDDRNIYSCPEQPRHMSVAVDKFNYRLPYADIFGGITALTKEQLETMNGYSNDFWGWGGEDDEMASRVKYHGFKISRYSNEIARYKMVKHLHENTNPVNKCRYNLMYKYKQRWDKDGINSILYTVVASEMKHLYTWVKVDLLEAESRQRLAKEGVCKGT